MGRHSKILVTKELKEEIIAFYNTPSSARAVEDKFGINLYQLNKILRECNQQPHDDATVQRLKVAKLKQNLLEQYGVDTTFKIPDAREKTKQTNLERYGVEYAMQNKLLQQKSKETCIKNHDGRTDVGQFGSVEHNAWITKGEFRLKTKSTCLERYGVENINQLESTIAKTKATNMQRYGVDNPLKNKEILAKKLDTQKKNNSLNTSKQEELFYKYLLTKYDKNDIIRQYSDARYPFQCDFYIKSEDLFIELNLSWTHGQHAFDKNNKTDIELLEAWRAKDSSYYKNAIETWTERDVKKQQIAKENNLNYKTIYWDEWKQIESEIKSYVTD